MHISLDSDSRDNLLRIKNLYVKGGGKEMRRYVLTASFNGSATSVPVLARDNDHAKTIAHGLISQKYVSDKRWDKGKVTLTPQYETEDLIIEIPEVED